MAKKRRKSTRKGSGRKWMQAANERMERKGTKGSYGHHSMKQMLRDKAKGGAIGRKANFAINARKAVKKRHHKGGRRMRRG